MCYVCGRSNNKIVHTMECRYVKMIPDKNKKYFGKFSDAYKAGYVRCKYCSPINMYLKREEKELKSFCNKNGLCFYLNEKEGCLDIISKSGKWKIIVNGQKHFIWLYHKNVNGYDETDLVPGYHSQKIRSSTLMGYMNYIVRHDDYRDENPLYDWQRHPNAQKGSKKWMKDKRKAERMKRTRSIKYVTELLNNMALGDVAY